MLAMVTTEKKARMPMTTKTTRLWTRATSVEPATLSRVMATSRATAKTLIAAALPSVNAELA